jgi:hypothetical protein
LPKAAGFYKQSRVTYSSASLLPVPGYLDLEEMLEPSGYPSKIVMFLAQKFSKTVILCMMSLYVCTE